ncbi:hypothetical protein K438DRAFT_1977346 [Mycena galopus ATCC 62051]|nr:hypothetical protein K438DRAFT_1977346 [Mycena galopus ATCC 62051]
MRFLPAFAVALDAYVGSSTEAAVAAEIRKIPDSAYPPPPASPEHTNTSTWFPQLAWLKKRKDKKRQERKEKKQKEEEREEREEREALVEIIKTHRLPVLPLTIAPRAVELSKDPENIGTKFIVLILRTRTPRWKPCEAGFQTMLEVTKDADDLAKRQRMLGAALVIIDMITSDGTRGILCGTPVALRPSALKGEDDDWEIDIMAIINEGSSIKEMFTAHEIAGTLPLPHGPTVYFGCIHIR